MRFVEYIEEKIMEIIGYSITMILLLIYFLCLNISIPIISILIGILIIIYISFLLVDFYKKKKKQKNIIETVDQLEEAYLISEILPKPKNLENKGYYYALKKACQSMNNKISKIENNQKDYQEYLDIFVHEIKTPISAISLYCDNQNNIEIQNEIKKIDNLVEQILFLSRTENPEKDYFVKEIKLEEIIHTTILNYKNYLLQKEINIQVHDLNNKVYTDEKWLLFIISQIIQNSIKYMEKNKKTIEIYSIQNKHNTCLFIKDNGIGIKKSEIIKIFEKGFTCTNRKKEHATGMGLYLCKKLCDKLNLNIEITSETEKYTEVKITFPKGNTHRF